MEVAIIMKAPFKKRINHMNTSKYWLVLLLLFGVFVLCVGMFRGESTIDSFYKLKKSHNILQEAVASLENQNKSLKLEIMKIRKSSDYAHKVLREKYHLTEKGERIVFFGD